MPIPWPCRISGQTSERASPYQTFSPSEQDDSVAPYVSARWADLSVALRRDFEAKGRRLFGESAVHCSRDRDLSIDE